MDAIEETVNGNGRPGLKEKMAVLEDNVPDMSRRLARVERTLWMGIGGLAVLQVVMQLIVKFLKL